MPGGRCRLERESALPPPLEVAMGCTGRLLWSTPYCHFDCTRLELSEPFASLPHWSWKLAEWHLGGRLFCSDWSLEPTWRDFPDYKGGDKLLCLWSLWPQRYTWTFWLICGRSWSCWVLPWILQWPVGLLQKVSFGYFFQQDISVSSFLPRQISSWWWSPRLLPGF